MLRILIAEDSDFQRLHLKKILSEYGDCDQAENGEAAVELARRALASGAFYDLIVMDILMPGTDGHAALKKIVEMQQAAGIGPDKLAKVIMLSCLSDPENILTAQFNEGADIYITKPYEPEIVVESLANLNLIDNPADSLDSQ
ncbi:MAG: response regulator [Desulfovibrionaceae bacterium]|nr:response regulator [Desulfovibrionaceae bacterium]MBF0514034.1 response regulator [Desulfovibrionaceae bacterium]